MVQTGGLNCPRSQCNPRLQVLWKDATVLGAHTPPRPSSRPEIAVRREWNGRVKEQSRSFIMAPCPASRAHGLAVLTEHLLVLLPLRVVLPPLPPDRAFQRLTVESPFGPCLLHVIRNSIIDGRCDCQNPLARPR